jgi:hypothetical protein
MARSSAVTAEYGRSVLIIEGEGEEGTSDLFKGIGSGIMNCWMSHADAAENCLRALRYWRVLRIYSFFSIRILSH